MELQSDNERLKSGMSEAEAERRSTKARLFGEDVSDHLRKQVAKARFLQALAQPTGGSETGDIREGATQPISLTPSVTVEPIHIGRYTVLRKLGEGGMGVVYAAYDEDLDRKIAIKLLRGSLAKDERGRVRIRREAQALARLSHPNVVQVHEIGTWGDHDFVAMEFVAGKTLDRWLASSAHTWREVLDVMLHAGRGLAAAHAAELVHRDFKPANILVGDDGRARVLDFGLARSADDTGGHPVAELLRTAEHEHGQQPDHDEVSDADTRSGASLEPDVDPEDSELTGESAVGSLDENVSPGSSAAGNTTRGDEHSRVFERELTATGAVLGTPVYMAPEQHLGRRATASSDQFSFCFVLYEALFGERPFQAENRDAYAERVIEGAFKLPSASSGVPRWLRDAVCRGLARQPDDRWPSMDALLTELSRDRESVWKRSVVAVGLVGALGLALLVGADSSEQEVEQCSFDRDAVVEGWTETERASVREAFENSGHALAEPRLERTLLDLDTYADELVAAQTQACTHRWIDQVQTDAQFELRMACLAQRKAELRAAIDELSIANALTVQRAPEVLIGLSDIGLCSRVELLERYTSVPKDEATVEAIAQVRASLIQADTAFRAGRLAGAQELALQARERATQLDYAPLIGEVAQLEGELAFQRRDYDGANSKLLAALRVAESTGDPERRLDAVERLARVKLETGQSPDVELAMAEALVERLGSPVPKRALLYLAQGESHRRASRSNEALDKYNQAIDLVERGFVGGEQMLAGLLVVRSMVLESVGRADEGRADLDRALGLGLSPDDVNGLNAVFNLGVHEIDAQNYDRAKQLVLQALEGYERVYGPRYAYIGHARLALARIAIAREQDEEAERQVLLAREVLDAYKEDRVYALDAHAALLLSNGRVDEAIELLTRAVDGDVDDTAYLAYLRSRLGRALANGKQYEQALVHLDQAIEALDGDPPQIDIVAPLTDRGMVWRNLGRLDRSVESLRRAVELTPPTCDQPLLAAQARVELALTLDALGQHEEAREAARAAYGLLDNLPDERATLSPVEDLLSPLH